MSVRESQRRRDLRRAVERDLARHAKRGDPKAFWRSLALLGSVGWPVALLGAGGALLGRWIDLRRGTGVRDTLLFLVCGVALGSFIAWRALRGAR